ncbi:endonuclease/exonuclease/phosphatase family protein [Algoriphagus zhangzhouensis]|uniref:Metal-dependent hydrolase, endonuclease/exonuclease/phosphatase family n=1 Tax=Algoriphagus zhangzhouensis TaxID=1073327 RepID=A0A1M7ZHE8_9BACT|nr:endonuclease/exonuclease/phosphatase family protein [Algoriphagus zhangzhouensis]TDY44176.1 endonuclease/exonuclease/phosphatase family metal-dependent hydrolase [Algoriphagus zhangzhouensis]SHO64335.1 Metal-dependent hydrolase, endonuclease/exonuclease/phosphatase family [Algoriphagus zhangzhouensis]
MKKQLLALFVFLVSISAYAQGSEDIKVSSFNLRMDTPRDSINAWPNRKEMVKSLIQYHDFDIIGTQEGFIHQLTDLMEMPGFAFIGAGRDDGKQGGEHSAIIYKTDRFKVLESGDFWLRENPDEPGLGWDATCCNRIASWGLFKDLENGNEFYVFNAHFDHQGVVARKESGKLMVKKMKEIAKGKPVICTGDFNSTPDTEQIIGLSEFLNDSYKVSKMKPYGPVGTTNAFVFTAPMKNRIDYVFVSDDFEVSKYAVLTDALNQRYPSDHLPVVATVNFK